MKVLHVLYSKIYTGAEKVAAQIIKAFEGKGCIKQVFQPIHNITTITIIRTSLMNERRMPTLYILKIETKY